MTTSELWLEPMIFSLPIPIETCMQNLGLLSAVSQIQGFLPLSHLTISSFSLDGSNKNNLLDNPCHIYNMDESGMPLRDKTQITIVACASASGHTLPPMVIFKGEKFNPMVNVPGTLYGMSENGWIDQELFFFNWLEKLFIPNIPPHRPVILLYS